MTGDDLMNVRMRLEGGHLLTYSQGGKLLSEIERLTRERDEARAEVKRRRKVVDILTWYRDTTGWEFPEDLLAALDAKGGA
jgi:hypothetical protein